MAKDSPPKKHSFFMYAGVAVAAVLVLIGSLKVALKLLLPPEKARALVAAQVEDALHREVRIADVGLSLLRGLVIEKLEVSERPDFKAGVFGGVESFELTIRWAALLKGRILVDRALIKGPHVRVIAKKDGKFNFSDLIDEPADAKAAAGEEPKAAARGGNSKKSGDPQNGPPKSKSPFDFELNISKGRVSRGRIVYVDQASGSEWTVTNLAGFVDDFSFSEPFDAGVSLIVANRGAGTPVSASLALGTLVDLSQEPEGKYGFSLNKLELELADPVPLSLRAGGKITIDPDLLEARIKGTLAEAALDAKLKVKDYAKTPKVRLDLSLSRLDLARLSPAGKAGEKTVESEGKGPGEATKAPPKKTAEGTSPPMSAAGAVKIAEVVHPGFEAKDFEFSWNLNGITPKLDRLRGSADLNVGTGEIKLLGAMSEQNPLVKVLASPFTLLNKLGGLGGLKVLPDLSGIAFTGIIGKYSFQKGLMTLDETRLTGPSAHASASGTVDLPGERLDIQATAKLAKLSAITILVTGTFDKPKTKVQAGKALTAPAKKLLRPATDALKPAEKFIKGIFKKK